MIKKKLVTVLILVTGIAGVAFAQKAPKTPGGTYEMRGEIWGEKVEESEWNSWIPIADLIPNGIKNNTTYKITVTGTSDKTLKKLRAAMCAPENALIAGGWDNAWTIPTMSVPAKKPFTYTTMMVSAGNAASMAKDLSKCELQLSNQEPISTLEQKDKVIATLTKMKVSIEEMPEGTYFMRADIWDGGNGEWQGDGPTLAVLLPKGVKNNTTYTITVTGTSDTALTDFCAYMLTKDTKAQWDSLTGWDIPRIKVDANKPFTYTASLTTKPNAAAMAKNLSHCLLRLDNKTRPKGHNSGDLMAILTNVKITIEEVK